jgi:hypothetical protein
MMARLQHEIEQAQSLPPGVSGAFADLVELLALGPEPELRVCPDCGTSALRAATICARCWTHLTPLATPEVAA